MAFVTFKTYMYSCTRAVTKARGWGFLSMATMNMIPINTFIGKKEENRTPTTSLISSNLAYLAT